MAITFGENAPFRYDIVGSFLRPDVLKQARADFEAGAIDANQLKTVEDIAIRDLVAKQKAAGLKVITDGEFRRSYWHLDFMWGLQGIERRASREGYQFHDEETTADTAVVTGPVSGENHPSLITSNSLMPFPTKTTLLVRPYPPPSKPSQK